MKIVMKDSIGVEFSVGDTVGVPSITSATFTVIDHEDRGVCLHAQAKDFEAYVSIEEAEQYGIRKL